MVIFQCNINRLLLPENAFSNTLFFLASTQLLFISTFIIMKKKATMKIVKNILHNSFSSTKKKKSF